MRVALLATALLFVTAYQLAVAEDEYFGKFFGSVVAEWLPEGRAMKLAKELKYEDPNGMLWIAPENSVVDGASIPDWLWSIIGAPFSDKYRDASVVHDVACQEKKRTWEAVHSTFYYAMRASGVGASKAKVMYAAVYHFGPRWPIYRKQMEMYPRTVMKERIIVVPETIERQSCSPGRFGVECFRYPETRMVPRTERLPETIIESRETIVEEPPTPFSLSKEQFATVMSNIEAAEKDGKGLSLAEIQELK